MLPSCNSQVMLVPVTSGMTGIQTVMIPVQPAPPILCPPNHINMCLSTQSTSEYDSRMYGRFRHVGRDHPHYRHAPFDWYRPPKQRHNVVHEDAAVVTLDGPVPIGDFYRHYIYGEGADDYDDDDSTSYGSEEYDDIQEPSYGQRNTSYQRQPYLNGEGQQNPSLSSNRQPMETSNYSTLNPTRRSTIPPSSNYSGNR